MKKFWDSLSKNWKIVIQVGAIITALAGGGTFSVEKIIPWFIEMSKTPSYMDAQRKFVMMNEGEIRKLKNYNKALSDLIVSQFGEYDSLDYYIVFEDGAKRSLNLVTANSGDVYALIQGDMICRAVWSNREERFFIINNKGVQYWLYNE